ncbi:zona pellucida sperm-binding protein 3-like [Trichosurus vulpecula]|uniref:zona pellucida sperm-binding protein 3-like n=1 Tax=Trichosurus vulpecula TaxID=9337 RepID=UPI00186B12A8|nr:zona pellucida sperm-binding protein 3-like [Trichosurus vulpecula]
MGQRGQAGCLFILLVLSELVSVDLCGSSSSRSSLRDRDSLRPDYKSSVIRSSSRGHRVHAQLLPVRVVCLEMKLVANIQRDLFGKGKLINPSDLTLGPGACQYTAFHESNDTIVFEAGLHECGSRLQVTTDLLVYSINLYYNPTPAGNSVILRNSPAVILIECSYPRRSNVSSKAIQPTWTPFSSMLSSQKGLKFTLQLMTDDWSTKRVSSSYQLGDVISIQADVNSRGHVTLRLFIDSCVVTSKPNQDSTPSYTIIDFHGCLVDGRPENVGSTFISPRAKPETLQFIVDAFKFSREAKDQIYITCHLKATEAADLPDPSNKACSFNKSSQEWSPVEGTDNICSCCEAGSCRKGHLPNILTRSHWKRSKLYWKDEPRGENEAHVVVGPLVISDVTIHPNSTDNQDKRARTNSQGLKKAPKTILLAAGSVVFFYLSCYAYGKI